ncbi:LLM class F420-dependent oxidoreductase [Phenylobacterium sp. LjRoot219]|uniref:LLM class F420-dependent oxidoreductase n=1 Tax=Phenylobacterium sp. LjRoot219 TaxID=3342283 RepID=UPI003ED0945E
MKVNVTMPFDRLDAGNEFITLDAVIRVATLAERLGFHSCLVTDHPVPTGRWLDAGGHHAQDPFVILSLIAAATRTIRLQTGILVLPYRNPFITARSVATLDVFSGGRVSLGIGAGYMKGEYKALGVDFERRNELTDEYLRALKAAWTADEFTFEGSGYQALGNRILPRPLQQPHPPLLIGGNAKRAIRRAVELGDAWNPYYTANSTLAATSRTAEMSNEGDLAEGIAYLRAYSEQFGRERPPEVILGSFNSPGDSPEMLLERAGKMQALGVSVVAANLGGRDLSEWCDTAERFAADVLSKMP